MRASNTVAVAVTLADKVGDALGDGQPHAHGEHYAVSHELPDADGDPIMYALANGDAVGDALADDV